MKLHYDPKESPTAIVLSGGGARAAYQVGVLQAISRLRQNANEEHLPTPFPIMIGTSAGALNAAALACSADNFGSGIQRLSRVWRNFSSAKIYRTDELGGIHHAPHWLSLISVALMLAREHQQHPTSLLDNLPLLHLLQAELPLTRISQLIHTRQLDAIAVTASNYSTGEHMLFYEAGPHVPGWSRPRRRAVQERITHQHLMASTAIPFLFPPVELNIHGQYNYLGDGAIRQVAPLAAAVHLGAKRIVVIGAGQPRQEIIHPPGERLAAPNFAQVTGHILNSIFLDALPADIEHAQHINRTIGLMTPHEAQASGMRALDILAFTPSKSLNTLALSHLAELPASIANLLSASSGASVGSASLASYLLFESGYTRALIELGRSDAMERKPEICAFFGW